MGVCKRYFVVTQDEFECIKDVTGNEIILRTVNRSYAEYLCMLLNENKQTVTEVNSRPVPDIPYLNHIKMESEYSDNCIIQSDKLRIINISPRSKECICNTIEKLYYEADKRYDLCKEHSTHFVGLQRGRHPELDDILLSISNLDMLLKSLRPKCRYKTMNYLNVIYKMRQIVGIRIIVSY